MNKQIIGIVVVLALVIGGLFWWMDSDAAGEKKDLFSNWQSTYRLESKDPQDLGFFQSLLETHTGDTIHDLKFWEDAHTIKDPEKTSFVFVGEQFGMTDAQFDRILTYVDSGATLYMAFDHLSSNLYNRYFEQGAYTWDYSNRFYCWIDGKSLVFPYVFQNDTIYGDWYTFSTDAIKDSTFKPYFFALNEPVAFEIKRGEGSIHFHSTPDLFKNYQVIQQNGFLHTEAVLAKIPKDHQVVWMSFADLKGNAEEDGDSDDKGDGQEAEDTSLIQFIMKHESLRTAFLLSLVLLILYVVFRAKRRENVLPGVPDKRNLSLSFVETLSSIYLTRHSTSGLLLVMRKNFIAAVQRHFYLEIGTKGSQDEVVEKLIEKSGYDGEKLRQLIYWMDPRKNEVNEKHLGMVYREIRAFYQATGIVKYRDTFVALGKKIEIHKSLWLGGASLLFSFMFIIRGLYMLAQGAGIGVILVIAGAILSYLAYRFIAKPLIVIENEQITVNGWFWGKTVIQLDQAMQPVVTKEATTLHFEDGNSITIRHAFLSRSAKSSLFQFIEHIKQFHL